MFFQIKKLHNSFLNDAIKLACSNDLVTEAEINWLKNTANANDLNTEVVDKELKSYQESPSLFFGKDFALFSII